MEKREQENVYSGEITNSDETKKTEEAPKKRRKSFFNTIIGASILGILIAVLGGVIGELLCSPLKLLGSSPYLTEIQLYLPFIGIWILCALFTLRKKDRHLFSKFSLALPESRKMLFIGALTGLLMNIVCIAAAYLNGDIYLYFNGGNALMYALVFLSVLVQSGGEEIVMRFFVYQKLNEGYKSKLPAILVSSLLFSLMHYFNPGVSMFALVNIALIGLFYSLIIYYFDSIWFCILNHTLWNFTQNFIFGLPNSGHVSATSILKLDASKADDSFFYNIGFGVEASAMATVIIAIAVVIVIILGEKKKKAVKEETIQTAV